MEKESSPIEGEEVMEEREPNLDNLDLGNLAGLLKNVDINQIFNLLNSIDIGQLSSLFGSTNMNTNVNANANAGNIRGGKEVQVLSAIRPMVNSQRAELIDMILQIYSISKILK